MEKTLLKNVWEVRFVREGICGVVFGFQFLD